MLSDMFIRQELLKHAYTDSVADIVFLREVVKTTILEQDPPNHKIVGGVCLHPPCLTSKDGVFIA